MAKTYTQIYIHIVFSVKSWTKLISKAFQEELHKYITGIIQNNDQKLLAVNTMPDHIHIFIGLKPNIAISDLVRDVKSNSSKFINEKKWLKVKFHWQEGFAAFSYSQSQLSNVINYIQNQEKHHITKTFREEYIELLNLFCVDYDSRYIFD